MPPNRLAHAHSPYLLQHQHNPVDWYEWGAEAFDAARQQDKPVFLSIGYATCHWCHVMAHESFEDAEVAALLNAAFISIKLDREERPDIDHLYMTVCQLVSGHGGWPLTVLLTPDQQPFYVATYIPKHSRYGRPGLMDLIPRISALWQTDRPTLLASAAELTQALQEETRQRSRPGTLDADVFPIAFEQFTRRFDPRDGGFGGAPKFPSPHNLLFLLRFWRRTGHEQALMMVTRTLDRMRLGGVYDHLGYGFHRYATDAEWRLPHFEKMLYDQALLTMAATEAHQATGNPAYAHLAREVIAYVQRDLAAPEGVFYAAEDADSEGREGAFYVWTTAEVQAVLGDDAEAFMACYNLEPDGNFLEEATREKTGENVLFLRKPLAELAQERGEDVQALTARLAVARERLHTVRQQRPRPLLDDKVLTDWNGLMIAALAKAGRVLREPAFLDAAHRAADFLLTTLRTPEGRLLHRYRGGVAGLQATLDDYAFLIWGLLECYQATFDPHPLKEALRLQDEQIARFRDEDDGGFFFTPDDGEPLLARAKELYDGAVPSGNAVTLWNLVRLARMTGRADLEQHADALIRYAAGQVRRMPSGFAAFLVGLDFAFLPTREIVVAGRPEVADTRALLHALDARYLPDAVVLFRPEPEEAPPITKLAPFTASQRSLDGHATAYVCHRFVCARPVATVEGLLALLP
jgi:hypothetical protein